MNFSASLRLFILGLLAVELNPVADSATHPQDVNALRTLYRAWSSHPSSWDTSTDPCEDRWRGVTCDFNTSSPRVVRLILINQDLNGNLPAAIGDLTSLTQLDLSCNSKLGGEIPSTIGSLTNLSIFLLQSCNFSGTIPSTIGNMKSLQFLALNSNFLTGSIPPSIGNLSKLFLFDLANNNLSGNLPDSTTGGGLDTLTSANHFHFQNNSFSGSIPSTIFKPEMTLIHLLLNNNSLSGIIPPEVGNLTRIDILRMDFNNLTGQIPDTFGRLANLTTLQLNNNRLSGQLPDLSNLKNLQILDLSNNPYEPGEIPSWILTLKNLSSLSLQSGNLIGEVPAEIFHLSQILNVTLGSNKLNGTLDLRNASSSLLLLDVQNNSLSSIEIGNYSQELKLDGNPLCNDNTSECTPSASPPPPAPAPAPVLPTAISNCSCPNLSYLPNPAASGECLCSRPVVGDMNFAGYKEATFAKYTTVMEERFAQGLNEYLYGGSLNLTKEQIDVYFVSSTQAIVSIFPPSSVTSWNTSDADEIAYTLNKLDISFLDLGCYTIDFTGSPYLIGIAVTGGLGIGAKVGIGFGVAAFVIAILVVGAYASMQKKRGDRALQKSKPFASWRGSVPQLKGARWFSFVEMKKATNNFSESNEIGAGGYGKVYKGYLPSGEKVAIKRAQASSLQGAAEFKNEIELLSRVHHKNLVGLIGFCFERGEQMLVYEFMPNGTMRDCLSGRSGVYMDWERRLAVALDCARGIDYLHTQAYPPIIHRDIKSSNILLDEKLVAKVADFGLSLPVAGDGGAGKGETSTQITGTWGYLDPEYLMTYRLSDKSDVYSFGVVLLELITGRRPIEGGRHIARQVRTALEGGGLDGPLIDPHLEEYPRQAVETFVGIALSCVEEDSAARPTMGKVVRFLEALARKCGPLEIETDMDMDMEKHLHSPISIS